MAREKGQSRVYLVKRGTVESLVRASSKSGAIAFVSRDVSAEVASQDAIIAALSAGAKVDDATEATEAETTPDPAPEKPAKGKK